MLEAFFRDLKHSIRMFLQTPAFTLAAVAALTLGIGANTAIFSVVNAVLLKPVGFPDPGRVVMFMNVSPQGSGPGASPAKFMHFRAQTDVTQDVSAFRFGAVNFTGGGMPEQLDTGRVSADFFKLVGAPVALGRTFTPDEDLPNAPLTIVLSHAAWRTRFNSDPAVVGKAMSINNEPHTIVGVLGAFDFNEFGVSPEVWLPFRFDPATADHAHYFQAAGRLRPGVTLEQADARLAASGAVYRAKYPNAMGPNVTFGVTPVRELLVRDVRRSLLILASAVGLVLLIACANVANLLLVRASTRRREIAIRAAIGGSRARIVRQLLTESVLLSGVGGLLGLFFGWIGIRALLAINTAGLPRVGEDGALVGMDWRVVLFTLVVSLGTGILFGLIPAFQSSRTDLTVTLKETAGRSGTGLRQNKARSLLVVTEVALALVLLIGSALLIRSAVALARVQPGFDVSRVLTMRTALTGPQYQQTAAVHPVIVNAIDRLKTVPGVVNASATCCVPLDGGFGLGFRIVGRPLTDSPNHGGAGFYVVSPGYFEVFQIPLKRGRTFSERDVPTSTRVVIINEAMARRYWPDSDPLNDRLLIGRGMREFNTDTERQIIGVVGDTRDNGLNSDPQPMMYMPQSQLPDAVNALNLGLGPMIWVVRTDGEPGRLASGVQEQLRQATGLPVTDVRSMAEIASTSTSRERFNMWLMSVFGASALLLAAIGIYGLMAYSVEQRTQEIGIRLALGAQASQVKNMVVRQGMLLALAGVFIGVVAAFLLARYISTLLFGVTERDPLVFVSVPLLLGFVALVAVWLPARRASKVDPIVALRYE